MLAPKRGVHTTVVNMLDPEMVGTPMHAKRIAQLKLQLQANDGTKPGVALPGLCAGWGCTCQGFSEHFAQAPVGWDRAHGLQGDGMVPRPQLQHRPFLAAAGR